MPAHLRIYVYTVKRDEAYIKELEAEVALPSRRRPGARAAAARRRRPRGPAAQVAGGRVNRNPQPIRLPAWLRPLRGAITLAMKRARIAVQPRKERALMVNVPVSTVEKPLTPIDFIAAMDQCITIAEVRRFASGCPDAVRSDERFTRAVAARLLAVRKKA
jgi:hypothetical protein